MDIDRCFEILNTFVPIHCSHIGDALIKLSEEVDLR